MSDKAFWHGRKVGIFGGASFIGSHLVDTLVRYKAQVKIVDDLSSGKRENIAEHLRSGKATLLIGDARDPEIAKLGCISMQTIFHLAAAHGGRGYVDTRNAECAGNLLLDQTVFRAAMDQKVENLVYASSGCVYPDYTPKGKSAGKQPQIDQQIKALALTEDMVGPPYDADNMYGWAKLMAEFSLRHFHARWGFQSGCARIFTCYGPRAKEDHAVMAMIARAFIRQRPFEVWGDGSQVRNWTYVSDVVEGLLLIAEMIRDGSAYNIGTATGVTVDDAARLILQAMRHEAPIEHLKDKPTGPLLRVCDNSLAQQALGWIPQVSFQEGIVATCDWYSRHKNESRIREDLPKLLFGDRLAG